MRRIFYITVFLVAGTFLKAQFTQTQLKRIDSLQAVLKNPASHDTSLAGSWMTLSDMLYVLSIDTMIPFCEKSKEICERNLGKKNISEKEKFAYRRILGSVFNNLAVAWKNRGNSNLALEYHLKGLQYRQMCNNQKEVAQSYGNLGQVYDDLGQIEKALDCYQRCLIISEKLNDKSNKILALSNIAYVYKEQGELEKARDYYKQSAELAEELKEDYPLSFSLVNLGGISLALKDTSAAKNYLERAMAIQKKIGNKHGLAYTLSHLGTVYARQNDFEKSEQFYKEALKIREEMKDKEGMSKSLNALAGLYTKKDLKKAFEYAAKAMEIAQSLRYPIEIKSSAWHLKNIYTLQGKYKEALAMGDLYHKMRDSIQNGELKMATVRAGMKNEFEKKEAVMKAALKLEMEKKEMEEKAAHTRKNLVLFFTLLVLATVCVFSFLLFKRFRLTQKQKTIIEEQKKIVEEKQKEVMDSIRYASRIQSSLLPNEKIIGKFLGKK